MLIAQRPTLTEKVLADNRSQFSLKPLEPGFGYTLGNSLRRTLLSSIPGAAITSLRFEGVLHEFTTIEGVKEDVTEILLNLKSLVVSSENDEPVIMYLRKSGAGAVTGADIAPPAGVEIHNPDLHIATLNSKAKFEVEMTVERGRGYVPATLNKQYDAEIGQIPVDSIYSPVLKVTYRVEATRVAQRTDFDELIIDVETKSSISPRDALASAGSTLVELFSLARGLNEAAEGIEIGPSDSDESLEEDYNLPVEELNLTQRSYNCLKREGIHTVGELTARSEADLMDIRNFGQKSITEVKEKLDRTRLLAQGRRRRLRPRGLGRLLLGQRRQLEGVQIMPTPTKGARLGGGPAHERLMLANLAQSLFEHGRITTTVTRAKRLRPYAERLITFAKRGDLASRRRVMGVIHDKSVVHTLFTEIGPSFAERNGGYTRITKVGIRKGDNAPLAVIELVEGPLSDKQSRRLRGHEGREEGREGRACQGRREEGCRRTKAGEGRRRREGRREDDGAARRRHPRRTHPRPRHPRRTTPRAASSSDLIEADAVTDSTMTVRVRLDLSYDGTDFAGWADQPGLRTVQGTLEDALARVVRADALPHVVVAGRTDAGVHARGQVAHLDIPMSAWRRLPGRSRPRRGRVRSLRAWAACSRRTSSCAPQRRRPPGFSARHSASERRYAYRISDAGVAPDPLVRRHVFTYPRRARCGRPRGGVALPRGAAGLPRLLSSPRGGDDHPRAQGVLVAPRGGGRGRGPRRRDGARRRLLSLHGSLARWRGACGRRRAARRRVAGRGRVVAQAFLGDHRGRRARADPRGGRVPFGRRSSASGRSRRGPGGPWIDPPSPRRYAQGSLCVPLRAGSVLRLGCRRPPRWPDQRPSMSNREGFTCAPTPRRPATTPPRGT